jgi:site-specific recombinase XerD
MFTSDNGTLSCITLAAQAFPPLAIPVTGAVDVLSDLVEAAHQYATEAKAPSTRRAYKNDWNLFTAWCAGHRLSSLPAAPETVAAYVSHMTALGRKVATIGRALVSISQAHQMARQPTPTTSSVVRETMRGIRRAIGVAQTQKAPVLPDQLRLMLAGLPDDILGVRDRALLLLGFVGGFRRSEIVALDVVALEFTADGLVVNLRRSKTDQDGEGRKVASRLRGRHAHVP